MSSAYGAIARPVSAGSLGSVLPRHATLRSQPTDQQNGHSNNHQATLFAISKAPSPASTSFTLSAATHATMVNAMHKVFNTEVERGDTYPQEFPLDEEQFGNYFLGGDAFVLIKGEYKDAEGVEARASAEEWDKDLLGFFYVKPNFPGRCSHICNGGFMVNPRHRGLGLGGIMGKAFLKVVPLVGYRASMFNLVFESNVASVKLWRRLGFKEIGRIPNAGRLRGQGELGGDAKEGYVDAIQFYWDFESMPVPVEYDA